jgi:hypothetical protein
MQRQITAELVVVLVARNNQKQPKTTAAPAEKARIQPLTTENNTC